VWILVPTRCGGCLRAKLLQRKLSALLPVLRVSMWRICSESHCKSHSPANQRPTEQKIYCKDAADIDHFSGCSDDCREKVERKGDYHDN
jgi:hypothetical protein